MLLATSAMLCLEFDVAKRVTSGHQGSIFGRVRRDADLRLQHWQNDKLLIAHHQRWNGVFGLPSCEASEAVGIKGPVNSPNDSQFLTSQLLPSEFFGDSSVP